MVEEITTSQAEELKVPTTLKALIEALIFAAKEPLSINQIRTIFQMDEGNRGEQRQIDTETIRKIVEELNSEYEKSDRPYRIVSIAGGYQFATRSEYAEWLGRLHKEQGRRKLSQSGVETLAIIAYKQPITKAEIEKIRGVNCDYVLKTLLEKELIAITGRAETVGRPLLYGTTKEFLKHFGLNDVTDLPRPREIEEILGESQFETERRMLEAQAGAEAMKKEQEEFKSRLPHIPKKKAELEQKGAQIFTRKRIREIRILHRTENENSPQEQIDFSEGTNSAVPLSSEPETSENTTKDIQAGNTGENNISQIQNAAIEQNETNVSDTHSEDNNEALSSSVLAEKNIPDNLDVKEQEQLTTSEPIGLEGTVENAFENNVSNEYAVPEISQPSEPDKQKSRWKVWKEKIQGFIKKIFD
ncbi:MAG TPA: SMC-Scp complex subunit ScpB [Bacteroidota bacterium]|nr:SMC-Scp complex subunit ScpB [Bacteroidota bacterium]